MDVVCKHLNLLETAYFGLRFVDASGQPVSARLVPRAASTRATLMPRLTGIRSLSLFLSHSTHLSHSLQHWLCLDRRLVKQLRGQSLPLIACNVRFPRTSCLFSQECLPSLSRLCPFPPTDVHPLNLYFGVRFYAVDPCKLAEEITRYTVASVISVPLA